jgi:hypothetical protein
MKENIGFKEVCSGLERLKNLAGKQAKIVESRDAARSKLFSLADLQSDSATKISKFLNSFDSKDRESAEHAVSMEILTPLLHHTFVSQRLEADESPFARSHSSTGSARIQTNDSIARESAQRDRERELWEQKVQNLQHANV